MTCADCDDRLDRWLQGRLPLADLQAMEAHLRACAACRQAADETRRLRDEARQIVGPGPRDDGWSRLSARLESVRRPRTDDPPVAAALAGRRGLGWHALGGRGLAVAALLTVVIGGSLLTLQQSLFEAAPVAPAAEEVPSPGSLVESIEQELDQAAEHYERAIAGLEQVASESDSPLDPTVTATLRENLRIIDEAIDDSRTALRAEPTSQIAQESLFDAFRRKVTLLQDTIALMNEMRKGNQAGAASIATGLSKG